MQSKLSLFRWPTLLALLITLILVLGLASYSPADAAFSTTGDKLGDAQWRNVLKSPGAWGADMALLLFGRSAWWLVALPLLITFNFKRMTLVWTVVGAVLLLLCSSTLEAMRFYLFSASLPAGAGGVLGRLVYGLIEPMVNFNLASLLALIFLLASLTLFFQFSWLALMERTGAYLESLVTKKAAQREQVALERADALEIENFIIEREEKIEAAKRQDEVRQEEPVVRLEPSFNPQPPSVKSMKLFERREVAAAQASLFEDDVNAFTHLPPLSLLSPPPAMQPKVSDETLELTSRLIERKLAEFKVKVKVVAAQPGPVITRYEIEPDVGVKGAQIVTLAKDLARAMGMAAIRVVETIPGKTSMGLEVPNPKRQLIGLIENLSTKDYADKSSYLTMALGKDIAGRPITTDLGKMPHCLVAGTTGSGKSVAVNAMILSILYKATPRDVRLVLIDPKMLELSIYEGIPHLLCPVVTDVKYASNALAWCVAEMERRYKLLSILGTRTLASCNKSIEEAHAKGRPIINPITLNPENPEPLEYIPQIVVVIDELADLMMVEGKKVEAHIARLAQKARAAGIHLILATQRPSVDVITGLIKANIPSRISFQVSSKIDSRTVLDQMGAEALLGQGDMLYFSPAQGVNQVTRVHGAFVSDEEVHRVVDFIKSQGEPQYVPNMLDDPIDLEEPKVDARVAKRDNMNDDELYDLAVQVAIEAKKPSISLIQRRLGIGYGKSANLVERMEREGLVSAPNAQGVRSLLGPRHDS